LEWANHTLRLNACGHAFGQFRPEIPLVLVLLELVLGGQVLGLLGDKVQQVAGIALGEEGVRYQLKKHKD